MKVLSVFEQYLSLAPTTITLSLQKVQSTTPNNPPLTHFTTSFQFGCQDTNPKMTPTLIQAAWDKMITLFTNDPIIREYFTFPAAAQDLLQETTLTPSPSTVPTPDQALPNSGFLHYYSINLAVFVLIVTIMMLGY